jgi:hypothetical protein
MLRLKVAAVPVPLIKADVTVIAGGENTGTNENVAPVRFTPVTWKLGTFVLKLT